MKTSSITLNKVTPKEGMYLKDTKINEVYKGTVYLAKSQSPEDLVEITEAEYQKIIKELEEQRTKDSANLD